MNRGLFAAQINDVEKILGLLGLLQDRVVSPPYSKYSAADFRALTYLGIWQRCYLDRIYDFLLTDQSLLQFRGESFNPLYVSYAYYECPYRPMVTLEEFLEQEKLARGEDSDEYELFAEYELLQGELKESVTPLRYDHSPHLYEEGCHPASHVHFGHRTNIRVGTKKILRPISFALFTIRQCYPNEWKALVASQEAETLCRNISQNLEAVDAIYWQKIDSWEMALS